MKYTKGIIKDFDYKKWDFLPDNLFNAISIQFIHLHSIYSQNFEYQFGKIKGNDK